MKKSKRNAPALNAGSMADIAFLLLIFFLVATQIVEDEGIRVKLPPLNVTTQTSNKIFFVKVNQKGELLVEKTLANRKDLKFKTKSFLRAHEQKAVVSFQCDEKTNYEDYIQTYQLLKTAYLELWDEESIENYGKPLKEISKADQDSILVNFPMKISEADPFIVEI